MKAEFRIGKPAVKMPLSASNSFSRRSRKRPDIVLIDARPARRVANEGTIPGAINISDTNFDKEISKLPADKNTEIIYFCQGFACDLSEKSARKAKALGYTKVRTFPEGHPAYVAATGGAQGSRGGPRN
jgi:rhodanese-related sulfurtransferase